MGQEGAVHSLVRVSTRVHGNSVRRRLSSKAFPLATRRRSFPLYPFTLPGSLAPRQGSRTSGSPAAAPPPFPILRRPSLVQARSPEYFNLHYVRPRIAEGSIKFLLSRAAFYRSLSPPTHARHLSNELFALSSSAAAGNYLGASENRWDCFPPRRASDRGWT